MSVCVCVLIDLTNRWSEIFILYSVASQWSCDGLQQFVLHFRFKTKTEIDGATSNHTPQVPLEASLLIYKS